MVSGFTACHRIASPRPPMAPENIMIWTCEMVPLTVGRPRVRAIAASIFCSTRQLNAAAAPATSAMPSVAAKTRPGGGRSGVARSIPITAVNTMSETTRGLVRRQNCTPMPGTWAEAWWSMGTIDFNPSTYLGGLQQPLEILEHPAELRVRGPAHHHVAARIDEVDVGAVVGRARRQEEPAPRDRDHQVLDGRERRRIGRGQVVHHEDTRHPRRVAAQSEAHLAHRVDLGGALRPARSRVRRH